MIKHNDASKLEGFCLDKDTRPKSLIRSFSHFKPKNGRSLKAVQEQIKKSCDENKAAEEPATALSLLKNGGS